MSRKMSLALLASVSCLGFADRAAAIEASPLAEPQVIYANQPAPPAPVRMASAERSNMGGGFIQFLFGDGPGQGYEQQPMSQQQRGYGGRRSLMPPMDPQQSMPQQEDANDPAQRPFDPRYEK